MNEGSNKHDAWARLRFSVVGPLLAAPPPRGELGAEFERLAAKTWRHPVSGEPARFSFTTIERWYYRAKNERQDPVKVLRRRVRKDAGLQPSLPLTLREALRAQYEAHPGWSYQLHTDNLRALAKQHPELGTAPSYPTVRRFLKSQGMFPRKRLSRRDTEGAARAEARLANFEVRSYEAEYVHGLWHSDFHVGSRNVLTKNGRWVTPHLFGAIDDRSRIACHVQWYLAEAAETFVHGLSQAIQKRGLPRALMTDNGAAMLAAETQEGLAELGVIHETTLPYSAYQNAKQEHFWVLVEGRLVPMLESIKDLTLDLLNEATQAWAEQEYNRSLHSEIATTPLARFLEGPSVGRESPDSAALRRAFRMRVERTQRRSDGTISLEGVRFEVPSRFRHLERLAVRYARWDLSRVDLVDPRTAKILCPLHPLDKVKNAEAVRRAVEPIGPAVEAPPGDVAPLLANLMADYAATGLPPAYLPHEPRKETNP